MTDPKARALRKILDEHRAISAVLAGLRELARIAMDPQVRPEFPVFNAMIHYIDTFPERLHHPKEEQFLFAPLLARDREAAALVGTLSAQHEQGGRLIRELHRALLEFEISWPERAGQFREAVERYAEFHWDHMRREERELLPLAERHLQADDWRRLDEAFAANEDPLAAVPEDDFARLFTRIANLAPPPVGLGEPWKKGDARG